MLKYVSNRGGGDPVDIETAILNGYAPDGGLYVPEQLPQVSKEQLREWKGYSYRALAFEISSLFIDRRIVPAKDLKAIINIAYDTFEKEDVVPIKKLQSRKDTYIMELFYGATLSFKDVGLAFLVNLVDYFLQRKKERLSLVVATTGDTGPAAASYTAGKYTLDIWVLYPKGMVTEEQERQMTTLSPSNVHAVGVYNCPEGGDDLDAVINNLYANKAFKEKVKLSSVNSINWGRIMIQTVHYFYGYLQMIDTVGEAISFAVPSGGFGNLCAGGLALRMGLPIKNLVIANNKNACLNRIFKEGIFSKAPIHETISSAIDILIPINFWRFLYFCVDRDASKIKHWAEEFESKGVVSFDKTTFESYKEGFLAGVTTDENIAKLIKEVYEEEAYLLDPHTAVALAVADDLNAEIGDHKVICLSTAHPAKFPEALQEILQSDKLPKEGTHPSIEQAKTKCQRSYTADCSHLEEALLSAMENHWDQTMRRTEEI